MAPPSPPTRAQRWARSPHSWPKLKLPFLHPGWRMAHLPPSLAFLPHPRPKASASNQHDMIEPRTPTGSPTTPNPGAPPVCFQTLGASTLSLECRVPLHSNYLDQNRVRHGQTRINKVVNHVQRLKEIKSCSYGLCCRPPNFNTGQMDAKGLWYGLLLSLLHCIILHETQT